LDARSGELRKHGVKIRAGQQTLQILAMLLAHPGELILREEIRQALWPSDTVVEFDHSINAAIQKLRDALGDTAGDPQYIETLPRRGYRFIGEVEMPQPEVAAAQPAEAIIDVPAPPETLDTPSAVKSQRSRAGLIFASAVGLFGVLSLVGWLRPWEGRAPARNWTLSLGSIVGAALVSPDGSAVLYRTPKGLIVRHLDSLEESVVYADPILDTPAWSNDSKELLFKASAGFIRLPLPSGPPVVVWPEMPISRGFTRTPGGPILSANLLSPGGALFLIPPEGGTPARLEVPGFMNGQFFYPEFLPDGKNFLFAWRNEVDFDLGLYLATLEKGKITRGPFLLRKNLTAGHYSPAGDGCLLFVDHDTLFAQKLNVDRGRLEGDPKSILDEVASSEERRQAFFSVSRNGVLVWRAGRAQLAQLTWFDRKGNVLGTSGPPCEPEIVRMAADQKHVLVSSRGNYPGYSIVEENRDGEEPLGAMKGPPLWTKDSSHLLFAQKDGGSYRVLERTVHGDVTKELFRLKDFNKLRDISPDSKVLLFSTAALLYSVRLDGFPSAAKPQFVADTRQGRFSPDGRWVIYSDVVASKRQIFAQRFPAGGPRTQLSSEGGQDAIWRGDGQEILYRQGSTIYSLQVKEQNDSLRVSPRVALFQIRVASEVTFENMPIEVTRDGSKILFAQATQQPDPQLTYVMTAWDTVLRQSRPSSHSF
jgi:DNA-binding winged helix-turn-helix (wHTH) protein